MIRFFLASIVLLFTSKLSATPTNQQAAQFISETMEQRPDIFGPNKSTAKWASNYCTMELHSGSGSSHAVFSVPMGKVHLELYKGPFSSDGWNLNIGCNGKSNCINFSGNRTSSGIGFAYSHDLVIIERMNKALNHLILNCSGKKSPF